jgi:hypothetical protein
MRILIVIVLLMPIVAKAEPFLAVEHGYQCGQCHINPTGGGLRNAFGSAFSQTQLPARTAEPSMLGSLGDALTIGVDARGAARQRDNDVSDDTLNFATDRVTVYLSGKLNDAVELYLDQQVAPGGTLNREAWARFSFTNGYIKAGRIFLPYGLRLEDDSAKIRQITNINFSAPDTGVEIGHVAANWSAQLSVTNGTSGAFETDDGKMVSARFAWVQPAWRVGVSANDNNTDTIDRRMYGVFAGLRTGPVTWLAELDRIRDENPATPTVEQDLGFLEANWKLAQGHYLRLTAESRSGRDSAIADSERYAIEYQWFPLAFTHLRAGARTNDSDNPDPALNEDEIFLQLHVYF